MGWDLAEEALAGPFPLPRNTSPCPPATVSMPLHHLALTFMLVIARAFLSDASRAVQASPLALLALRVQQMCFMSLYGLTPSAGAEVTVLALQPIGLGP